MAASTGPDPILLLDGLRAALPGSKALIASKGLEGLFPANAKGKQAAQAAVDQGFLTTRTEKISIGGKGKPKDVVMGGLTDNGRRHVLDVDSPKAILEALLPAVQALGTGKAPQQNEGPFRAELGKATQSCVKAIEDAFAKLQKSVETALAKLEQAVVKALPAPAGPAPNPAPVLAALQAALARVSASPTTGPNEALRRVIRTSYDELCHLVEFRDKLVEIPRLYHETSRRMPGLTLAAFHQELEALSKDNKLELHKLNEVQTAKERHLAIEKNDRLFYYVMWK